MTDLVLTIVLVGQLNITSYRSVTAQTDDSPNWTSIGERCNANGVALSRDLLSRWGGPVRYGDFVYIEGIGFKKVNDVMNGRIKNGLDVWVSSYPEEKAFAKKWNNKKAQVWLVRRKV